MASEASLKQCYNKGCGKKYSEEEDAEGDPYQIIINYTTNDYFYLQFSLSSSDACIHHPGVPVFHDAMKVSGGRILMMTLSFECDYVCMLWYI